MKDTTLIEAMARAIAKLNAHDDWRYYQPEAMAALEAYRVATQDDMK